MEIYKMIGGVQYERWLMLWAFLICHCCMVDTFSGPRNHSTEFGHIHDERSETECQLLCIENVHKVYGSLWKCNWQKRESFFTTLSRSIMKNAKTNNPNYPFLVNASSLRNSKLFLGSYMKIENIEDLLY